MDDRTLLELAAKAAGMDDMRWSDMTHDLFDPLDQPWNALEDNGDTLSLAVRLHIQVEPRGVTVAAWQWRAGADDEPKAAHCMEFLSDNNGDEEAATRRAVVRCAAALAQQE
jgi:hypothetical protein